MSIRFSHKLTDTNIYGHLLYRIHEKDAQIIDQAGLLNVLKKSVRKANKQLDHADCNILIFADSEKTIPEEGIGGLSWGNDWIRIDIDPNTKLGVSKAIQTYLPGMVAHELHHTRRGRKVGYGETLGETLISEGLTQVFQETLYPDVVVRYAHYLTKKELEKAWEQAQPLLKSKDYDHKAWFYGKSGMKRWTGYSLGYDVVQQYLEQNQEQTAALLVDTPTTEFLKNYYKR